MTTPIRGRRIFTIKEVADYVGVHSHAIVHAEKCGRIPAARRDELGHRVYADEDRKQIGVLMGRR